MTPNDHNMASMTIEERARYEIDAALEGATARWAQLETAIAAAAPVISTESAAESFTTVIAQLQALEKRINLAHDDAKGPYLEAGRIVDGRSNALFDKVRAAREMLQERLTAYQVDKQRRIEAERAAIRKAEEADPEPAMTPHVEVDRRRTRVRSVEGASAHLASVVTVEIVDPKLIPDRYLRRPKVLQALIAEITPDVRKGDVVEGTKRVDSLQSRVTS